MRNNNSPNGSKSPNGSSHSGRSTPPVDRIAGRWSSSDPEKTLVRSRESKRSILIEPEKLCALVAGDHVKITTKQNQIIDGIVYCSIPQVPPLCIIHQYNPAQTKNVYIVSLNEISRCLKFDEPKQPKRDVELRPIDNERANEILEKNLAERKAKMDTLNIEVDDSTQELFDFMYRTLPNKCVWSGTTITFPDSKISIADPYDSISLNGST